LFCEKNRICIFFFVRFLEIKMAREASTFAGIRWGTGYFMKEVWLI
jgi:hypothetical protein